MSYCFRCAAEGFDLDAGFRRYCQQCHLVYFQNTAATASAVIICGDELLFTERARDPSKGLFDFPGGFVDPDETLEAALVRELREELNWQADDFQYFMSAPNTYEYRDVTYKTTDAYFLITLSQRPYLKPADDVAAIHWMSLDQVTDDHLAFEPVKQVVKRIKTIGISSLT